MRPDMQAARARSVLAGLVAAVVWLAPGASAQAPAGQQAPPQAVVMKGKAPVSNEVLRVTLPRPEEADLPNGLHLMVLEDRRAPQVFFQMVIPGAGGYADPADLVGLATFTAALMREGTATRTSDRISEDLERLAASLAVGADMSGPDARVSGSALTEHVGTLLDLTADVLINPSFPEEEIGRYKTRMQASLTQQRSSPGFLALERYNQAVYGDHPGGRVSPGLEALERVTREALVEFHRAHYAPDHAVLALAGDVSMAEARRLVESRLGAWKKAGAAAPSVTHPKPVERGVFLVARPNSVQTNLLVGAQAIERTNPDYSVVTLMNQVIGGGPTGRLFRHLREEKGYTYGAYSGVNAETFRGDWSASTQVRTEVTQPALADLLDEVRQMREVPVPAEEFLNAKKTIVASFALRLEQPAAVLNAWVERWRYGLPADYWDRYPERIMAVTQEQVMAAARQYLDPSRLQVIAVGNSEAIAEYLATLGPLVVYDVDGKKIGG